MGMPAKAGQRLDQVAGFYGSTCSALKRCVLKQFTAPAGGLMDCDTPGQIRGSANNPGDKRRPELSTVSPSEDHLIFAGRQLRRFLETRFLATGAAVMSCTPGIFTSALPSLADSIALSTSLASSMR